MFLVFNLVGNSRWTYGTFESQAIKDDICIHLGIDLLKEGFEWQIFPPTGQRGQVRSIEVKARRYLEASPVVIL